MAEKRNPTGKDSAIPGYIHEIRGRHREIIDAETPLPHNNL